MTARGHAYYDASYKRILRLKDPVVWGLMRERCEKIARYAIGANVIDVGCGLGLLAGHLGCRYTGLDFSQVVFSYVHANYPDAKFILSDAFKFLAETDRRFDTVILSEILEHVVQPARLYEMAAAVATKRIIWTVPRDLPAPAHVWPVWPEQAVDLMLSLVDGECVVKERFGGEDGKRWWIVVQDVKK